MYFKYKLTRDSDRLILKFTKVDPSFDRFRGWLYRSFPDIHVIVKSVNVPMLYRNPVTNYIDVYLPGISGKDDFTEHYITLSDKGDFIPIAKRIHAALSMLGEALQYGDKNVL